ncbi:hypothetical protein CJ739_2173 [Mariniflexile rhizosphaerae]|uniref:hypothetical protein n=1 Tax=unclassified Mariniflexile TaxID=2643887 RepID=UPI000E32FA7D|nr:hypothetical protein [Mariniflexile sp. TRM1-10]AXP81254.1 hypothetical protein CJ739_2173 [Mariniflexile sp. TRM1-10]
MAKKQKISFQFLIKQMGTSAGTAISILTLLGMGFTAGIYYNNYVKNVEILDIKKNNFMEVRTLKFEIESLKLDNKELIIKITDYEQGSKK